MFEQALLPVRDEKNFAAVLGALDHAFSSGAAAGFLKRVQRAGLQVRSFEGVLAEGLLGADTPALYGALGDSDRGQVREHYLRLVEQVAPELRKKFLKVYAYY